MQKTILALLGAAAFGLLGASSVLAAPANGAAVGQLSQQSDQMIQVRGGCGRTMHRNMAGECRPGCGAGWHFSNRAGHCVTGPRIVSPGGD